MSGGLWCAGAHLCPQHPRTSPQHPQHAEDARQAASRGVGGFSSRTQLRSQIRGFPPFPMLGVAACPASGPLLQQLGLFLCPRPAESPAGCWGLAAGMGSTNSSLQTTPGPRLSCTSSTGHCMSNAIPKKVTVQPLNSFHVIMMEVPVRKGILPSL